MLRKIYYSLALSLLCGSFAMAQNEAIRGKVIDKDKNEPIPFANVIVELNGSQVGGAQSDFDGNYTIKPIRPGRYTVKASFVGYQMVAIQGVVVNTNQYTNLDIKLSAGVELKEIEVVDYAVPLITKDGGSSGGTLTKEEIAKMPGRSADAIAVTVGGVYSQDGAVNSIRGSRADATDYYIDGVKIRGSFAIPKGAQDQVAVITGGLPSNYGDATGGIISITTAGPSRKFFGGVELVSSELFDKYGYNVLALNVSGPLLMQTDPNDSTKRKPLLGFFLSAEATSIRDGSPASTTIYKVKDDIRSDIEKNPLRIATAGGGTFLNAEYLRMTDLVDAGYKLNSATKQISMTGKIDFATSATSFLTVGGAFNYTGSHGFSWANHLLNYNNNGQGITRRLMGYLKYSQRFNTQSSPDQKSASTIKNIYYTIQGSYSNVHTLSQDDTHKDDIFKYGYLGKFKTYTTNSYEFNIDTTANLIGYIHNGYRDTLYDFEDMIISRRGNGGGSYTFTPQDINPEGAYYTGQYYNLFDTYQDYYINFTEVQANGGLLNGQSPRSVYGLFSSPGTQFNNYGYGDFNQYTLSASGSADIKDHAIMIGFEYEQRIDREFSVGPVGLWRLANGFTGLVNNHIKQLDLKNPQPVYDQYGVFQDTVNYNRLYDGKSQAFFDYNLRKALGKNPKAAEWIDLDSYDPSLMKLDFFSADELLNNGNSYVFYYGYDYSGKKVSSKPSFDDFFTKIRTEDGYTGPKLYERPIGAFEPNYIAAYIQDKYAFRDIIFNVGLRVDRFDANQKVLADKYSLFQTKTAGEVSNFGPHPSNIENDDVVYVNDLQNPTAIVGYRNGSTWYDASGTEINDPDVLATATGIAPYLVDPNDKELSSKAFTDYEPQITYMPRIAFSFPISDEANFFAHYDVLSQRPGTGLRMDPLDYYFINTRKSGTLQNPNLRPEKTIEYELGFQQILSKASALKISGFYRELRDMIQIVSIRGAYPTDYKSYDNIDFGTVKGMTVGYDLRRTANVWLKASYTLQFADGTGSNATSAGTLVNSGQPNLRAIFPLDIDRRHSFNTVVDIRFSRGSEYNGPVWGGKQVLSGTGLNFVFDAYSGDPYTRREIVGGSTIKGTVNGARLPWQYRLNAKLEREMELQFGGKGEGEKKKTANLTVYLDVLNVLNTQNVLNVYGFTGNPDDDGYLDAPQNQKGIDSQTDPQSYRELYAYSVNSPFNYSLPRRMRLGVALSF